MNSKRIKKIDILIRYEEKQMENLVLKVVTELGPISEKDIVRMIDFIPEYHYVFEHINNNLKRLSVRREKLAKENAND
jgi:hypothetical protein